MTWRGWRKMIKPVPRVSAAICGAVEPRMSLRLPDRLQPGLDGGAARFQKRRQRQLFAERLHRLVGGEAGAVGGDLEQDAVGVTEIQAAEIEPVDRAAAWHP